MIPDPLSRITSGPVFPALNRGRTAVMPGVYNKAKCYGQWVKQLFTYVGGVMLMCRSHSIRKSAVKREQGSLVSSFVTLALPIALAPRPPPPPGFAGFAA